MLIKKSSAKNRPRFLVFLLWNVVRFFSLFTQGLNKMESREGLKEMFCNFGEKHIRFPPQAGNIMLLKFLTYAYCVASWRLVRFRWHEFSISSLAKVLQNFRILPFFSTFSGVKSVTEFTCAILSSFPWFDKNKNLSPLLHIFGSSRFKNLQCVK